MHIVSVSLKTSSLLWISMFVVYLFLGAFLYFYKVMCSLYRLLLEYKNHVTTNELLIFFNFWNYNLIVIFLLVFSSLQPTSFKFSSLFSFKFMFFPLIDIACIHVYIYTSTFLSITFWTHIMLLMCMFSGLIIWN